MILLDEIFHVYGVRTAANGATFVQHIPGGQLRFHPDAGHGFGEHVRQFLSR